MRAHRRVKELEAELDGCRCGKLGVLEPGSDRRSRTEHSLAEALHSLREDNERLEDEVAAQRQTIADLHAQLARAHAGGAPGEASLPRGAEGEAASFAWLQQRVVELEDALAEERAARMELEAAGEDTAWE